MPGVLQPAEVKSLGSLAEAPGLRECLRWFTDQKQWVADKHVQVCRVPAPTFFEQARAGWIAGELRALGCTVRLDGAGNVIARPRKAPQEPCIVLSAHLDTVLAPRSPEEIAVEADGGLRGPGVSDNGAGLAALLAVAAALDAAPAMEDIQCGLLLLANVCEEGEGNLSGMRHFCQDTPEGTLARAFLVLDGPATDHITCTGVESRRFEVTFKGSGGHSWSDFGTANPVHAMARAITMFLDEQAASDAVSDGRSSFNFGVIEGGSSINAIPAAAKAKVDLRSETAEGVQRLSSILTASVEKAAEVENSASTAGKVAASARLIGSRPGGQLPKDAPLLKYLRSVDAFLGIRALPDCASTDANIPLAMGRPAVSIGAGGQGGGAHTPSEWFHPRGRDIGLKRIMLTLGLLMRDATLRGRG